MLLLPRLISVSVQPEELIKKNILRLNQKKRRGRTKPDPFVDVWGNFLLPALRGDPHLEATFLHRELQQRYPGQYPDSVLRTLQRRISDWRAIEGPEKEIIFRQEHPPGWQCLSDFTDDKGLKVTINGEAFPHRFYHLRSAFSLWEYVRVITGGESFTALAEGLQKGLWELGGVFETHRTDSLSAAFKNKSKKEIEDLTERYKELCTHCGMKPTRNNKGVKHENGAVEISHRFFRSDLKQALSLRGSRDFSSLEEYRKFVAHRISLANARRIDLINEESKFLKPLPDHKACDFEEQMVKVTTSSLIRVKQSLYSVPSRLIGKTLRVSILTATRFVTDKGAQKNWTKIKELTEKYPDRFFTILTFEAHQANPTEQGFKYISNHAKFMIVDRKVMITGGSGIEDRWAYSDGLTAYEGEHKETDFVNASIAKAFRDKDFIVWSDEKGSLIETSVFEFYKLMTRWNHFCVTVRNGHQKLKEIAKAREKDGTALEAFHDFYKDLDPGLPQIDPEMLVHDGAKPQRVKVFASGPEQTKNTMETELIDLIDNAEKEIFINHMYIHPTDGLVSALQRALEREVKISIITNGEVEESPLSHKAFAPRSLYNTRDISGFKPNEHLKLYFWNVKLSTNHQKYIIIDEQYVLCGSSNFGYKGFDSMSDYEHNLLIESKELCQQLKKDIDVDLRYCKPVSPKEVGKLPGPREILYAALHSLLAAKIG